MKETKNIISTRGQWKNRELVMAVLAVLRAAGYQGISKLTAQEILENTGCNRSSLYCHLLKWARYGYLTRERIGALYHYSIAPRGNSYFEAITEGFLSRRKRQWIQLDTRALIRKLPAYQRRITDKDKR
ncbi:hypothetical protein ACFLS8_01770 [Chloroflexota bacterium]